MSISVAGAVRRRRPDRGDLPHLDRALPRAERLRRDGPPADGEGDRPDRGLAAGPARAGPAPRRRRRGDPQRRRRRPVRRRPAPAGVPAAGHGRVPRPVRRAPQGHAGAARRAGASSRPHRPDLRLLVVGRGDADALRRAAGPALADRLDVLGAVDDATKAAALRSVDVFCAPNVGGESFGMVLTEAMAAGAPVLASDLDAFRAVLGAEPAGALFPTGDAGALARGAGDPARPPGAAGRAGRRRPRAGRPRSTGRWWRVRWCGSTGPPWPPTPAAPTPWAPPSRPALWMHYAVPGGRRTALCIQDAPAGRPAGRVRGECRGLDGARRRRGRPRRLCAALRRAGQAPGPAPRPHRRCPGRPAAALDRRIEVALRVSAALARQRLGGPRPGGQRLGGHGRRASARRATRLGGPRPGGARRSRRGPGPGGCGEHPEQAPRGRRPVRAGRRVVRGPRRRRAARDPRARVHNDAVRDTLALRSRRLVRWLRLAGRTPIPAYFEIADPEPGARASADRGLRS